MDITIEVTEIIAESTINETVIYCDVVISDAGGSMVDVPIETASANGVPIPIVNKNIDIIIPTKTSDLEKDDVYTKSEVDNKLTAIYKFKGSVLTYAELPIDAENADVYNVEENGVNYAWVEATSSWDSLGGLVGLATLTENGLLSKEDFAKLQNLSGTNTGDETQTTIGALIDATELTEITDTSKIAASNGGVLNWFSGLRIKTFLTGFFAKLSGGNIFSNGLNNIQWIKDFEDALGNQKVGVRIGTISGVDVGSDTSGYGFIKIFRGLNNLRVYLASQGDLYIKKFDGGDFLEFDNVNNRFGATGVVNINGTLYYGASKSSDTINDRRTSNQSGVKIDEICTAVLAGGANVKGSGTWKKNSGISEIGGQMIALTNKTGAPSIKGTLVNCSNTTDNAFSVETSEFDTIGVVYESGIADGAECWVVISGIAQVLLVDGTASTRGYWTYADAVDGRANATLPLPSGGTIAALENHFKEIGHCLESKVAGTNVLAKVMLHFN